MALGKQIKGVRFVFWNVTADTIIDVNSTFDINIQNMDMEIMHEREGGGEIYTKSLDGTIIPYPVKSRYKWNLTFDSSVQQTDLSSLYKYFIDYNRKFNSAGTVEYEIRFYTNYVGSSPATGEYKLVWLDKPMEYMIRYQNTIGVFVPSISVICTTLTSTIDTDFIAP